MKPFFGTVLFLGVSSPIYAGGKKESKKAKEHIFQKPKKLKVKINWHFVMEKQNNWLYPSSEQVRVYLRWLCAMLEIAPE